MPDSAFIRALARSLLSGEPTVEDISGRLEHTLGRRWRWFAPLARRYLKTFSCRPRPRHRDVLHFLRRDPGLAAAFSRHRHEIFVAHWVNEPEQMQPVETARDWGLPAITSPVALAEWLGVDFRELQWFADLGALAYQTSETKLWHYHYRVLPKNFGSIRLIEAPKPRLKQFQRRVLAEILQRIPPHPAVHGFVKARSIKTFVAPHTGKRVVLRMDLQDFFPSFRGVRVQSMFRTLGYPESVADLLGGVSTNATPRQVWKSMPFEFDRSQLPAIMAFYARPHLPQGAPSSPALANVCAYRMDCRLSALANSAGAVYTRYADDLAFSGDREFERHVDRFSTHVAAVLMEEGFRVHFRKTRVMRQGVRQHLAGLVINRNANVIRSDFDRVKAILTNCIHYGPASQNRDAHPQFRAHLEGLVAFVEMVNPVKGGRLRALLKKIDFERRNGP
jgi:RNA-directed DNA polymerase